MTIRWWWNHQSIAHAYHRTQHALLLLRLQPTNPAPALPCCRPPRGCTIGASWTPVLCTRAAPAAHGTIFPGCPTPFTPRKNSPVARHARMSTCEARAGGAALEHVGRRAAGDARFLYDNECLWRARPRAGRAPPLASHAYAARSHVQLYARRHAVRRVFRTRRAEPLLRARRSTGSEARARGIGPPSSPRC